MINPNNTNEMQMLQPEFDSSIRRIEQEGVIYFSLVDMMTHFADSDNQARKYWSDTKKRLKAEGFDVSGKIGRIPMTDKTGKRKQATDVADGQTCMRIVQSIPSPKAEPIRQWLAQLGYERIEETANPELGINRARQRAIEQWKRQGKSGNFIAARLAGIDDRAFFTDALSRHVIDIAGKHYGMATNALYRGLWDGRDANELKSQMQLPAKASLRDYQPSEALHYQALVESTVARMLGDEQRVDPTHAIAIVTRVARVFGIQAAELGDLLGIDLATGLPLLGAS